MASVIPVRVYGCADAGPVSTILAGINFILRRMATRPRTRAVINMSFGGGLSQPLNNAVAQLVAAGAVVVAAAGNSAADACGTSPAGAADALAVAAIDSFNVFASFSNRGPCVDVAAPGVAVTSAWVGSPTATMVLSGTSMASPLAAGVAALVLQAFPDAGKHGGGGGARRRRQLRAVGLNIPSTFNFRGVWSQRGGCRCLNRPRVADIC